MSRVYNFSAGPAVLPEEVLKEAADEMLDYQGSGSEHGLTDFQIEFLWSVCSKYCSFITYEIMNVKWTNIVFVLRYGDETLHLWKPLLNTNDQRGSSQCLTQRNTIFVHFTFMPS